MKEKFISKAAGFLSLFSEIEMDEKNDEQSKQQPPTVSRVMTDDVVPSSPVATKQSLFDMNIAMTLENTIRENTPDFGYINFKDAIIKMKESMSSSDEASIYKHAFLFANTAFKITKQKLINSAKHSVEIVRKEQEVFSNDIKTDQDEKIESKKTELQQTKSKLAKNAQEIERLKKESESLLIKEDELSKSIEDYNNSVLHRTNVFQHTLNTVISNIEADIEKFKNYFE